MLAKDNLMRAIAGKNRGLNATEIEKQAILIATMQLEKLNPTPRSTEASDLLEGDWQLLYTTSQGLLGIDRFPLVQLGQIYQCIRTKDTKIYNIAEICGLPLLEGLVAVSANLEIVSEQRVQVKFDRSITGLQRLLSYQSPATFIQQIEHGKKFAPLDFPLNSDRQQGWLDITYLDRNLRIGRGNEGSLFVLAKI